MRCGTTGARCGWGVGRGWPGAGFFWFGSGWPPAPERERWIRVLEEYQRDLEQAAADVADVIRRVREDMGQSETNV